MKGVVNVIVIIAGLSLLVGVMSRIAVVPVPLGRTGIEAEAFLNFTNTCLLIAVVLLLARIADAKK